MNEAFYQFATAKIESMSVEELGNSLIAAGFDVTVRQFPDQPKPEKKAYVSDLPELQINPFAFEPVFAG